MTTQELDVEAARFSVTVPLPLEIPPLYARAEAIALVGEVNADKSALRKEVMINVAWQWDNDKFTPRESMREFLKGNSTQGMSRLREGQRHNNHVMALYDRFFTSVGASEVLNVLATTSLVPTGDAKFDEAKLNLEWQFRNNLPSLAAAHKAAKSGSMLSALLHLLDGQQHMTSVMSLYRACFRDNAAKLFAILANLVG